AATGEAEPDAADAVAAPAAVAVAPEPLATVAPQPVVAAEVPAVSGAVNAAVSVEVEGVLLEIVADKTGYPVEMLESGMDIEADLGIDSIKRVQIMGALQERYPRAAEVEPERLAELRTLGDIVGFIAGAASAVSAGPVSVEPVSAEPVS